MIYRFLAIVSVAVLNSQPVMAGPEGALFETANVIYQSAEDLPPEMQRTTYESVRSILNQIVADYPASDLALQIILKEEIEGLDVANVDAVLEEAEKSETAPTDGVAEVRSSEPPSASGGEQETDLAALPPVSVAPEQSMPKLPVGSEATERKLDLGKQDIRDLQARLLVSGHDPNGVDGAIGRGTRGAIRSWQTSQSVEPTGFLNASQLAALKEQSQSALDEWLRDDANARRYEPPAPIALGPRNMSGNWQYTTTCGANSKLGRTKITGIMTMRHAGGSNFNGALVNSQGLRARLNATLRGRNVAGIANFGFLLGRVRLDGRVDDQALILRGRDSNGCSFYARKS